MRDAVEPLALDVAAVAAAWQCCPRTVERRLRDGHYAHLRLRGKAVLLLDDLYSDAGREQLRAAWHGRRNVSVREVARALRLSADTLRRAGFPAQRGRADRDVAVSWLLCRRIPSRREVAA